jgi:chromosome segregation ATPase
MFPKGGQTINILLIFIDLERKVKLLSDENYELRERLLKKDADMEKLKMEESKVQENIVNKVLKKENCELHHEKEQLKLERDRLRHLVNEKQDKTDKLVAGNMRGGSFVL